MPNKSIHQAVGAVAGGGLALAKSNGQLICHQITETIGRTLAGYGFGCLPDILEPADTPNHRSFGHSATAELILSAVGVNELDSWQSFLRIRADRQAALVTQAQTTISELWHLSIMPENPRLLSLGMNGIPERSQSLAGGVEANQA